MASDTRITLQGDRQVLQVLAQLRGRLENQAPAWQEAGDELVERARQRFNTKADPDGQPWAPWSLRTARLRAKEGRGTLLEHTGLLRDSLGAQGRPDGLTLSEGRSYGRFHETGTRTMPRRGIFLGQADPEPALGQADARMVLQVLMDHLTGGSRG